MEEIKTENSEKIIKRTSKKRKGVIIIIRVVVCIILLVAGIKGAAYLKKSEPKAKKMPERKMIPLVKVKDVHPESYKIILQAMGSVVPSRQITLRPMVSGEITWVHTEFIEGGLFKAEEEILGIDQTDYRLDIVQKESEVAEALYSLKLELGHQDVARREWELLNDGKDIKELDDELALRKPHLEKARANLKAAQANLEQAKVNLFRTVIRAPFNSIVRSKNVETGSMVTAQDQLVELLDTDEYRVEVSVPVDRLKWISIPKKNRDSASSARIYYRQDALREGRVVKLLSGLENEGRMARVLISVKDPLALKEQNKNRPQMLIGEYVRVEIDGDDLENVYSIPRTALRDNTHVWLLGEKNTLHIQKVETLWRDAQVVVIGKGLSPGDRIIISDLAAPVEGMRVMLKEPNISKAGGGGDA